MRNKVLNPTIPSLPTTVQPTPHPKLDFEAGIIINIDKPVGWTSFDVVKKIRNVVKVKKVGHAGTLDPFATGVLLICTGRATKKVNELMSLKKVYRAEIELGKTTDSYDCTGKVTSSHSINDLDEARVREVSAQFVGEIDQIPPMFSALKQNGKRLYKLARKGITVDREPRRVCIHDLQVLDIDLPKVCIEVVCSRGTYIRALASDIGKTLGCGAYLKTLCRTRIGRYRVEDAETVSGFTRMHTCRS